MAAYDFTCRSCGRQFSSHRIGRVFCSLHCSTYRHGMREEPIYKVWQNMLTRCFDSGSRRFPHYGGRGITVCDEWKSFEAFLSDMGPRPSSKHSIDRINNDGNYEPGNCRWATVKEQCRNKSNNRMVTIHGVTRCMMEWCEILGIPSSTFSDRLRRQWTDDRLVLPPRKKAKKV